MIKRRMKKQTRLLATSDQKGPLIRSGHNYESEKRDAAHLLDGPTLRQTEKRTPASKLKNCAKKKGVPLDHLPNYWQIQSAKYYASNM